MDAQFTDGLCTLIGEIFNRFQCALELCSRRLDVTKRFLNIGLIFLIPNHQIDVVRKIGDRIHQVIGSV